MIWAACCHIQYDFHYELGISELLFHYLHQHLSLYLYLHLCLYMYLYQRLYPNLYIRLGLHLTLLDIQCFFVNYLIQSMRPALSRLWTWACMIKWYRAIRLFALTTAMSERGIWYATQIERQRNETHTTQAMGDGRSVCEPRATTDMCLTQWLRSSSRLCGRGGKEGGGGRVKESVCEMVVLVEKAREIAAGGPDRYNTRHERGKRV